MSRKHIFLSPFPTISANHIHTTHTHTPMYCLDTEAHYYPINTFFSYKLKLAVIYGTALCCCSSMEGAESISLQYRAIPTGVS